MLSHEETKKLLSARLSYEDRQKQLQDIYDDPAWKRGAMVTATAYVVAMLALVALALTGPDRDSQLASSNASSSPQVATQHHERASDAAARKVFEERRARFERRLGEPEVRAAR